MPSDSDQTAELLAEVRALRERVGQLESLLPATQQTTATEGTTPAERSPMQRVSRRGLMMAALAGGAAVATDVIMASPAAADDGDKMVLGQANSANDTTYVYGQNSDQEQAAMTVIYTGSSMGLGIVGIGEALPNDQTGSPSGFQHNYLEAGVTGDAATTIGVQGFSSSGTGVFGRSAEGPGVSAISNKGEGLRGVSTSSVGAHGISTSGDGVYGRSDTGNGVHAYSSSGIGVAAASGGSADGVYGTSNTGVGVHGVAPATDAILGESTSGRGLHGVSKTGDGSYGRSTSGAGVHAYSSTGNGVSAASGAGGDGVFGTSDTGVGVHGVSSKAGDGVYGRSTSGSGVHGYSTTGVGLIGASGGGGAQLRLVPGTITGAPKGGKHDIGELFMDATASIFVCTATGTPGTWVGL